MDRFESEGNSKVCIGLSGELSTARPKSRSYIVATIELASVRLIYSRGHSLTTYETWLRKAAMTSQRVRGVERTTEPPSSPRATFETSVGEPRPESSKNLWPENTR